MAIGLFFGDCHCFVFFSSLLMLCSMLLIILHLDNIFNVFLHLFHCNLLGLEIVICLTTDSDKGLADCPFFGGAPAKKFKIIFSSFLLL